MNRNRRRRPPGKFFTHGSVDILSEDSKARQLEVSITLPACVMQAVTPLLLGAGLIDGYEVRKPLAAWIPTVAGVGFIPSTDPDLPARMNVATHQMAKDVLDLFAKLTASLKFPGDLLPLLPMGTYVKFRLRCDADKLAVAIEQMGGAAGVAELRFALSSVLASVLFRWDGPQALSAGSVGHSSNRLG